MVFSVIWRLLFMLELLACINLLMGIYQNYLMLTFLTCNINNMRCQR